MARVGSTSSCAPARIPSKPERQKSYATSSLKGFWAYRVLGSLERVTAVASKAASATGKSGVDRGVMTVFAGLMLGSLVASLNMTLVAPALPTIVAELGGLADYSWIPISAMLASTIVTPVAGKLSDIYGRKPLYMTGIVVFAIGSALSGLAPGFWFLVFARFVQGAGMGFIMPLSLAIACTLLATVWGGVQYPWISWQIIGLYSVAAVLLAAFVGIELRAPKPVLPLRLWKSSLFTFANIASAGVAMSMFGAIFFLP